MVVQDAGTRTRQGAEPGGAVLRERDTGHDAGDQIQILSEV